MVAFMGVFAAQYNATLQGVINWFSGFVSGDKLSYNLSIIFWFIKPSFDHK